MDPRNLIQVRVPTLSTNIFGCFLVHGFSKHFFHVFQPEVLNVEIYLPIKLQSYGFFYLSTKRSRKYLKNNYHTIFYNFATKS